jgi:O-antigen ligase
MSTSLERRPGQAVLPVRILSAALLAVALLSVLAPRGMPVFLPLLLLGGFVSLYLIGSRKIELAPDAITIAFLILAAYCAINSYWSLKPGTGLLKAGTLLMGIVTASLMLRIIDRLSDSDLIFLARSLAIAGTVSIGFILIEVLTGQALTRLALNHLPFIKTPSTKHVAVEDGTVTRINFYVLKRNVGAMTLLLWPTLLVVSTWPTQRLYRAAAATGLFIIAAAAIYLSRHDTSIVAVTASLAIFWFCRLAPRTGRLAVLLMWLAASLLVVPVALVAYDAKLYCSPRLSTSAQARVVLWGFTAKEVLKRPILGVGINSTPEIDEAVKSTATPPEPCAPYQDRPGQHSHNIYMQTWYELGAVGAILLCLAGIAVWRALTRLPTDVQPFAFATATAAMCVAAFSWGMWQAWYLWLWSLMAILLGLAVRWAIRRPVAG